jgi:hypothetical protein
VLTISIPRLRWLVAVSLLALFGTMLAAPATAEASTTERAHEMRFVDSLNVERAERGIARLTVAGDLADVARRHSAVMARDSHLHHNPNLATDVSGWSRVGENVGRGGSVASLHTALMNSEGHRRNMLDTNFSEVGVGVVVSGSTVWVTQVFRLPNGTVTSASFRDVSGGSHATNIQRLYDAGITTGCNATSYCPDSTVTRAQMGTFLARSAKLMPSSSDPFRDLGRAPLHRANISALADRGITGGCDAHNFCPDRAVTRAQMATFLANSLGLEHKSGSTFSDVKSTNVHAGAINAIADAGITLGCSPGRYCPDQRVTRAEMASFLVRAFKL